MLYCAYLKTLAFCPCSQSYLSSPLLFLNAVSPALLLDGGFGLQGSLSFATAVLFSSCESLHDQLPIEKSQDWSFISCFSHPLCWHLLFSSSHSKIVWLLCCCTFSPDIQEFCPEISIPLLNTSTRSPVSLSCYLMYHCSRRDTAQFSQKTKLHIPIAL